MRHVPVLVAEVVEFLDPGRGGVFVDATLGLGGHARALLSAATETGSGADTRVIGLDRDPEALGLARSELADLGDRVELAQARFDELQRTLEALGVSKVSGVLADLGVSSLQLDTPDRGFSFRRDREGPLDMRMGSSETTAEEIVNTYSEAELRKIFRDFGEERQAGRIARSIVGARRERPLATTAELRELIYRAKGGARAGRRGRGGGGRNAFRSRATGAAGAAGGRREGRVDPATRVFQALRIEVNRELDQLEELLEQAVRMLDQNGRLVVISYHSLEDRIVKNTLRSLARGKIDEVTGRPHAETRLIEVLTKKPVRPSDDEIALNPRARSARLRAARRI